MKTVLIIYFSGAGHTAILAQSINKGAASVDGVKTNLIEIKGKDIADGRYVNESVITTLDNSDAIIFGAPNIYEWSGCTV